MSFIGEFWNESEKKMERIIWQDRYVDERARVQFEDYKWGFVYWNFSMGGHCWMGEKYDEVYSYSEGLAAVKKYVVSEDPSKSRYKWGFIDTTGKVVIPYIYTDVVTGKFVNGQTEVNTGKDNGFGDTYVYINKKGHEIMPTFKARLIY